MTMPAASPSAPPRRVLVRSVNWLGDAVMATPALQRLREALPDAHLTLLTQKKLADLWQRHPGIDATITFSPDDSPWAVARRLRERDFEVVLVLPNSPRSALEGWLARIPQRIGYRRRWCSWLLTHRVAERTGKVHMPRRSAGEIRRLTRGVAPPAPARIFDGANPAVHQIHDYLHLVAALGAKREILPPRLEVADDEVRQAEQAFLSGWRAKHTHAGPGGRMVLMGLNPGAEYGPAKRWSAVSFAAVARQVSGAVGHCLWLAFGGARDWPVCEDIARSAGGGVLNLAGKTSLRQLMCLLKLCRVVLTNDTGPMHVAAALGTPVVVPFGSTSPELTGPGLPGDPRHRLLKSTAPCSPCFRRVCPIDLRCMTGIAPERVAEAVLQTLERG